MKHLFKKVLSICILLAFISIGSLIGVENLISTTMWNQLPEDDKLFYSFMNREGKKLGRKYHMKHSGTGIGGKDKVWLMRLSFDRHGEGLNEEKSRELILKCANDFLEAINNNVEIRSHLENFPFSAKNIDLTIFNWENGHHAIDPFIVSVSVTRGEVGYFTIEQHGVGFKSKKYEPFEEVVRKSETNKF